MGEILALLGGFFFSSSNLMARQGMKTMDRNSGQLVTLLITSTVNIVAILILVFLAMIPQLNFMGIFYFGLAGVFTTFAGRFFLFASIERIGATRAGLFKVSAPMFTIFMGITFLGDRLTPSDAIGSALVLSGLYHLSASGLKKTSAPPIGIIPYAYTTTTAKTKENIFATVDPGVVFGLLSGLFLSVGHILRQLGMRQIQSPIIGVAVGTVVSLICITIYMMIKSNGDFKVIRASAMQALCFKKECRGYMWCGFFNTLAQYLFLGSLIYTSVSIANILISTEALFNLLLVSLFFRTDEPLSPRLIIVSLFILAGVVLVIL